MFLLVELGVILMPVCMVGKYQVVNWAVRVYLANSCNNDHDLRWTGGGWRVPNPEARFKFDELLL
jgi:hypothetical protein